MITIATIFKWKTAAQRTVGRDGAFKELLLTFLIGASLSEPHTSVTALSTRVCIWPDIYACLDWPLTRNLKWVHSNILQWLSFLIPRRCLFQLHVSHENEREGLLPDCRVGVKLFGTQHCIFEPISAYVTTYPVPEEEEEEEKWPGFSHLHMRLITMVFQSLCILLTYLWTFMTPNFEYYIVCKELYHIYMIHVCIYMMQWLPVKKLTWSCTSRGQFEALSKLQTPVNWVSIVLVSADCLHW